MKHRILSVAVLLSLLMGLSASRGGGKSAFDEIVQQMIDTIDSLTTTLATVQNEETAKEAQPSLRKSAAKWQIIYKKAKDLPPPSREEKDRVAKQFKMKLEESQKKLFAEVARVRTVPGGPQALLEISGVLEKKKKE
jgi:hypothetical protein